MKRKTVKLTESKINRIVKESVYRILNEIGDTPKGQYMLGRLHKRSSSVGSKPNNRTWYNSFKKGCDMNGGDWSDDFERGYKDETERKGTIKEDADDFDSMSYAQLRDELGIYDNDTLNVSIETEMEEKLEHEIWNIMKSMANGNPRQNAFDFREFAKIVKDNYGFEYVGGDEDEKCHFFENAKYSMYVSTKGYWYPKQGMMKVDNFGISKRIV